jgi:thioester reductase-like protein
MPAARVTLVTGFPNHRATSLVSHLLAHCSDHVWAVITPERSAHAERYREQLPSAQRERLRLFTGEPSSIDMGLSGPEYRDLTDAVGCIQHLAPTTEPTEGGEPCELVNVGGTREVLELATAARQLESVVIHSSVAVSGDREGSVAEADLEAGQRFSGPGLATLARAELMARRRMHRLPIVVLRTGQVVGPTTNGAVESLEGVYLLILLILSSPQELTALLPRWGNAPLHVVPMDCLVQAAVAASRSRDLMGQTLHMTDPNPMSLRLAFERCLKLRADLSESGLIPPLSSSLRRDRVLREGRQQTLPRPRAFINTTFRNVRYGTEGAERWFRAVGMTFPPLESYFEQLVRHVAETIAHPPASKAS